MNVYSALHIYRVAFISAFVLLNSGCLEEQKVETAEKTASTYVPGCDSDGAGIGNNPHCSTLPFLSISMDQAPAARDAHKLVWTGSKLIVWGGIVSGNSDTPGGIYDVQNDTWSSITSVGAIENRAWNPAVFWTGSKLLVWGGIKSDNSAYLNTGGMYDPDSDVWTNISTIGAPTGRAEAASVWTGNKLLVWGGMESAGNGGGSFSNSGGQYDPATDTWSSIRVLNSPEARIGSCAVWTGSTMLVWGGVKTGAAVLNTGGEYNPASDTWSAISTIGAPSARTAHSCVWTGSKMLVWGGRNFANSSVGSGAYSLNDGAIYDPVTKTWEVMSSLSAPSKRAGHFSVWTGAKLLIWGGYGIDDSLLSSGALFNPDLNQWETIPSESIEVRGMSYPSAVWTGNAFIVWGGYSQSYYLLDTGFKYSPQ